MRQLKQVNKIQNVLKYRNPLLLSFSVTTEEKNYNDSIIQLIITYTMEPSRTAAQEVVLSKKSIVLYPAGEGNAKVVLVKHHHLVENTKTLNQHSRTLRVIVLQEEPAKEGALSWLILKKTKNSTLLSKGEDQCNLGI